MERLESIKKAEETVKGVKGKKNYKECSSKSKISDKEKELKRLQSLVSEQAEEIRFQKNTIDDLNNIIEGLRYSRDRLIHAEKLSAIRSFTADVCHEIRNPLTSLGGFARRLNKKISDGTREKEYCGVIVSEVERLEKILRSVLTFSTDVRLHIEKHNPNEIVEESLKIYEDPCKEQSIDILRSLGDVPPVLIDREHIRHVIDNLLSNALDSMPNGGILTIATNEEILNEITYVTVKITDTGDGIPEEKLHMIFDPFCTTKAVGYSHSTGLGLSTSRKIMDEHSGFIKAESIIGKGSTFGLYFPYQKEEESTEVQCWEYMKCGRDQNAEIKCPAYPNFGRTCWAIAGTYCEGKIQGSYAQKIENCRRCLFFKKAVKNRNQ